MKIKMCLLAMFALTMHSSVFAIEERDDKQAVKPLLPEVYDQSYNDKGVIQNVVAEKGLVLVINGKRIGVDSSAIVHHYEMPVASFNQLKPGVAIRYRHKPVPEGFRIDKIWILPRSMAPKPH